MKIPSMVVFAMDIPKVTGGAVQSPSPFAAAPEAADAVDARRLAGVGLPDGEGGAGRDHQQRAVRLRATPPRDAKG